MNVSTRSETRLRLSALDRSFLGRPANLGLLHYGYEVDPERVYRTLLAVAADLPAFSSEIVPGDDGDYYLRHRERYFGFQVARHPGDVARLLAPSRDLDVTRLSPFLDTTETLPGRPLFTCRVTALDSGTALGFSLSHAIADGETLKLCCAYFSLLFAGREPPPISLQRSFEAQRNPASRRRRPEDFLHESYATHPHRVQGPPRPCYFNTFLLTAAEVDAHRRAAGAPDEGTTPTDTVTALVMKRYYSSFVPASETFQVRIPVDLRRVSRKIDPLYLGNAYWDAHLHLPRRDFEAMSVPELAAAVHRAVARVRSRRFLDERVQVNEAGIDYDRLVTSSGTPEFDPDRDVVVSSVSSPAHVRDLVLDLGGGPPRGVIHIPVGPQAVLLERVGQDYILQTVSRRPIAGIEGGQAPARSLHQGAQGGAAA